MSNSILTGYRPTEDKVSAAMVGDVLQENRFKFGRDVFAHFQRNYQVKLLFQVKLFGKFQGLAVAFGQAFGIRIAIESNGIQSGFLQLPNIIPQTAAKVSNRSKPLHIGKLDQRKGKRFAWNRRSLVGKRGGDWGSINWGELSASYSDAFGFTPEQFLQLTLPQLSDFASYAEKRDAEMKRQSKSPSSGATGQRMGSTKSMDQMVAQFGAPEAKAELLKNG